MANPVTEDVDEPIEEPTIVELEKQVLAEFVPAKTSLVGEPKAETTEETTVDDKGRPITLKRTFVTIFEEVPAESGKTNVIRRVVKRVRKTTEVDGKPVVEEFDEPEETETLVSSVPVATEASVVEECLPVTKGTVVGEPDVKTTVEETVDEKGRPIKIKRIFVTIIEEIVDDTGKKRTVKRVIKKTQKTLEVNGKPMTEDVDEPLDEPSTAELEKQVLADVVPEKSSHLGEPKVETTEEKTVDEKGRPFIFRRTFVTIYEEVPSESGKTKVLRRVVKKIRKTTEVDGKPVVEEYDEPEETETLVSSVPEATEASVVEECLPVAKGTIVGEPKVETTVEEIVDENGRPIKIKRIFVTIIVEVVDDTGKKHTVKRVIKKTQKTSEVNGRPVTEDVDEPIEEPAIVELEKQILAEVVPEKASLVGGPKAETKEESTVDEKGRPITIKRTIVTIFEEVPGESGKTKVIRRVIKKVRKVTEVDGKPVDRRVRRARRV